MRQVSIPKAIIEALNEFFDGNPDAVTYLIGREFVTDAGGDPDCDSPRNDTCKKGINTLDLINVIVNAVAPGKRVVTVHSPDGLDGFTFARERKPKSVAVDVTEA